MKSERIIEIRRRMRTNYRKLLRRLAQTAVIGCVAATIGVALFGRQARADITPANTAISFLRADPNEVVTNGPFYKNSTLLLTNCIAYASISTNLPQDLTGCVITVKVGSASAAYLTTNATIQSAAAGTFWTRFTVPTNGDNSAILQVTITDSNGTSYTYNWKTLSLRSAL